MCANMKKNHQDKLLGEKKQTVEKFVLNNPFFVNNMNIVIFTHNFLLIYK